MMHMNYDQVGPIDSLFFWIAFSASVFISFYYFHSAIRIINPGFEL
jgi:hypothetical protein